MIIDGVEYDDESWRIARVLNVRTAAEEHRAATHHQGEKRDSHYACIDCQTVYFCEASKVSESVHPGTVVDEKFMDRLVELAVHHGISLPELQTFLECIARENGLTYQVPDLVVLRHKKIEEGEL